MRLCGLSDVMPFVISTFVRFYVLGQFRPFVGLGCLCLSGFGVLMFFVSLNYVCVPGCTEFKVCCDFMVFAMFRFL